MFGGRLSTPPAVSGPLHLHAVIGKLLVQKKFSACMTALYLMFCLTHASCAVLRILSLLAVGIDSRQRSPESSRKD